jgi:hypothetical protein
MQTTVSENGYHSAGLSIGEITGMFDGDSQYGFITYNYHFNGFNNDGWVIGTGVGVFDEDSYTPLFGNEAVNPSRKAMFTVDLGYKF